MKRLSTWFRLTGSGLSLACRRRSWLPLAAMAFSLAVAVGSLWFPPLRVLHSFLWFAMVFFVAYRFGHFADYIHEEHGDAIARRVRTAADRCSSCGADELLRSCAHQETVWLCSGCWEDAFNEPIDTPPDEVGELEHRIQ